ncbi:MAG: histidinol dehydrogenase, partial [Flavobacteriales bacterium]|nr:histidinol dehydrogenase [Flavobacteriales bacterium]
ALQCGVDKIYKVGGTQAIAAMTLGTGTVPAVYKIFGPGNQYVMAAKQLAQRYGVAIDMPAGPSEVLVVADSTARARYVAADMLSQAEHGPDSQSILLTMSENLAREVEKEVERQLDMLPRRDVAAKSLMHSRIVVLDDMSQCVDFSNAYAPEHLILSVDNPEDIVGKITDAGSVFMGHYTPESAGDYASGTNHTLPTSAYARSYSGVNMDAFVKKITFQSITREGLEALSQTIMTMAQNECLDAHSRAVSIRLEDNE